MTANRKDPACGPRKTHSPHVTAAGDATEGAIIAALSEIDAMGLKAARGSGYAWGAAEEAGAAARWLAAHGFEGAAALAAALRNPGIAPHFDGAVLRDDGPLCPILLGAAVSDRAHMIRAEGVSMAEVLVPLLLLPPLCQSARDLETVFELSVASGACLATPEGPVLNLPVSTLTTPSPVRIWETSANGVPLRPYAADEVIDPETWTFLGTLAAHTYVPATEASRQGGAGAGTLDND